MKLDQRGSAVLSEDECRQQVANAAASSNIGRIAINGARSPYVIPVNFTVLDGAIVVRLGTGWAAFHLDGATVTFEVDQAAVSQHSGWSVVIEGVARAVTYDEVGRLGKNLPTPFVTEPGVRVFEIAPSKVTGRSVEPDQRGEHSTRDANGVEQVDEPLRSVHLDEDATTELQALLRSTLADLSSEIADTDNPEYRRTLLERRHVLEGIDVQVGQGHEDEKV